MQGFGPGDGGSNPPRTTKKKKRLEDEDHHDDPGDDGADRPDRHNALDVHTSVARRPPVSTGGGSASIPSNTFIIDANVYKGNA